MVTRTLAERSGARSSRRGARVLGWSLAALLTLTVGASAGTLPDDAPLPPRIPDAGTRVAPPAPPRDRTPAAPPSVAPRGPIADPGDRGSRRASALDPTSPDFFGAVLGDTFSGPIVGDERVIYAVGGVGQPIWIRQPELELRCDGVVIWGAADEDKLLRSLRRRPTDGETTDPRSILGPVIHAIYAEGNVVLTRQGHVIRAERVMIDFAQNRAYMVDAELHGTFDRGGREPLPLTVRARVVRGLAEARYQATDASVTTCSYDDPHYHFTTDSVDVDFSQPEASFETAWWPTLRVDTLLGADTPVLALPKVGGQAFDLAPLRDVSVGSSSRHGTAVEVLWGGEISLPDGRKIGEWGAHTDYYSKRGWGLGADLELDGPDRGAGRDPDKFELVSYYQRDSARQDEFSERAFDGLVGGETSNDRGRFWSRFRHHGGQGGVLPEAWRLDGEVAYWSDRGYLPEYRRTETTTGKQQETFLALRGLWGNQGVSILASHRIPDEVAALARRRSDLLQTDYATQTDYLPAITYHLVNQPLLLKRQTGFAPVNLSVQAQVASVKRRYDNLFEDVIAAGPTGWRGERQLRADFEGRVTTPFSLGPVQVTPAFGGSALAVDDRNGFAQPDSQYEGRVAAFGGLRVGTTAHRSYPDVQSETFGLSGLRHVVSLDAQYFNRFHASEDPFAVQTNDLIDELHETEIGSVRLRNRLQTRDGGETVDWIDHEVRFLTYLDDRNVRPSVLGFREDSPQPLQRLDFPGEDKYDSRKRNGSAFHQHRLRARLLPDIWVGAELDYDIDRKDVETSAFGARWAVTDRLSVYVGRRTIRNDSRIWTLRGDIRLTEKWALGLQTQQNTANDNRLNTTATLFRRSHDYTLAVEFDSDDQLDDTTLSFAVYPNFWVQQDDPFSKRRELDFDALRWYR